jgi:hypothetical protein
MSQHEQNTPAPAADAAAPPTSAAPPSEVQYPEQKHAGAVGYGPNYHQGPTVGEKATGLKEELVGKMKHDQGMTQHGHELRTGILKQKAVEDVRARRVGRVVSADRARGRTRTARSRRRTRRRARASRRTSRPARPARPAKPRSLARRTRSPIAPRGRSSQAAVRLFSLPTLISLCTIRIRSLCMRSPGVSTHISTRGSCALIHPHTRYSLLPS